MQSGKPNIVEPSLLAQEKAADSMCNFNGEKSSNNQNPVRVMLTEASDQTLLSQQQLQPEPQCNQLLQPESQYNQQLLGAPICWKSTPGAGSMNCNQPPRLSVSAILPLSAAPSCNNRRQPEHQQQSKKKRQHSRQKQSSPDDSSDRTMLPAASANAAAAAALAESGFAKRFFTNPRVQRSLAIDAATIIIFVPLGISTSIALMNLFVHRFGQHNLEWHHYLLVAALASLVLIPIGRVAYSGHRYYKRIRRMKCCDINYLMRHPSKERLPEYTIQRRRMEAECAADPQYRQYHEFAYMVARQQNINLSRHDPGANLSGYRGVAPLATAADRSAANISGISCHRPDISMAAYHC